MEVGLPGAKQSGEGQRADGSRARNSQYGGGGVLGVLSRDQMGPREARESRGERMRHPQTWKPISVSWEQHPFLSGGEVPGRGSLGNPDRTRTPRNSWKNRPGESERLPGE